MDVADRADLVTEAWLDRALTRVRRDAAALRHGYILGPMTCADCGAPIPVSRQRAIPLASRCRGCQELRECRPR